LTKGDFETGLLNQDSFIILSIISTTEISTVSYKVGKLKKEKIKEIQNKLCEIFSR